MKYKLGSEQPAGRRAHVTLRRHVKSGTLPRVPPLLISLVMSACLGALVGLIRQWSDQAGRDEKHEVDLGGVRTYTLWAMLGCLGAYGSKEFSPYLLPIVAILIGAQQIVSLAKIPMRQKPGGTTFASVLLTLFVGVLVFWGQRQVAVVVAATTMVLLGLKQPLHMWTRAFTSDDIRATLQFVAITGVILPLVPSKDFGPYGGFNLHSTWLMVVLISGLGFAGYIAVRLVGQGAGVLLTSFLGGLASSTATTLAFSRRSKELPESSRDDALAVIVACTVMLPRVLIAIGVLDPELAMGLLLPFAIMAVPGIGYAAWLWFFRRKAGEEVATPQLSNPLNLSIAVKFALLYAVISFLVKALTHLGLSSSVLPLSFVSGLTDMDAISLSLAGSHSKAALALPLAGSAIILAAVANSIVKAGLAVAFGSPALRRDVAIVLGLTIAAGVAAMWLV